MKTSTKIAFSGIIIALATVVMLISRVPTFEFLAPAVAGALSVLIVLNVDVKTAYIAFIATAVLSFFIGNLLSAMVFVAFLGYYPIAKANFEQIRVIALNRALKYLVFNAAMIAVYFIATRLLGMVPFHEFKNFKLGNALPYAVLVFANICFFVYDYALTIYITQYRKKFFHNLNRTLRR